jgi:ArsR family transcriptional regulator
MAKRIYEVKAEFFKALGHPVRVRILELLRDGERSAGDLVLEIGQEQSYVSQQLAVLRERRIVSSRREGSTVYYKARDPRIFQLLAVAKEVLTSSLVESQELLDDLRDLFAEPEPPRRRSRR